MAGPLGRQAHPRRLRPHRPHRARCSPTSGPAAEVPDGGLPLRRRPARLPRPGSPTCCTWTGPPSRTPPCASSSTGRAVHNDDVIRTRDNPLADEGGVAVLRGNLCPDGAVIKHIAAEPHLLKHTGPAVVFDDYQDHAAHHQRPGARHHRRTACWCCATPAPRAAPACPSTACCPIPDHLLKQGVRDMVRISDARMSGTSYGACVLHVAPESYVGGPLALVRTGDPITLDVEARALHLDVDDEELERRRAEWTPPPAALRARLRRALQRADHPGRHRLRLRVPGPAGQGRRTRTRADRPTADSARRPRPAHRTTCGKRLPACTEARAPYARTYQRTETQSWPKPQPWRNRPRHARRRRPPRPRADCRTC